MIVAIPQINIYFIQNIFPQFAPPSSTFGNKNMAAHFLVMTLPLAFAYTLLAKTRVSVIVMAFASFVGLWYIMYIAARQAYLAMFIEILILIIFLTIDKIKNNKHSFIYKEPYIKFKGLISFFVLLLLIFVSYLDKDGRISQINNSNKSSSNTYQHFMLHILTNFKGSSFVYDIRI